MIRVVLAEDHAVVRSALQHMLERFAHFEVVATAATGLEAVALWEQHRPDVVLMDLAMPQLDGIEATRRIVACDPAAKVVVLTSANEPDRVLAAVDAGALGYLLKESEPEQLFAGIRAAARGEAPLDPRVTRALLGSRSERRSVEGLSPREREILLLAARGLSNAKIATELGISAVTVKRTLWRAFRTIGVTSRTQAALWAQEHGLLDSASS